jgi:magnesium-transporting ATPase (P-type)
MNIDWHLLPLNEVSEKLDTSPGIDENTANQRQSQYGKNKDIKKEHCFTMILHQLSNFMILILIFVYRVPISGRNNRYRYYSYHSYCQRRNRFCTRIPS